MEKSIMAKIMEKTARKNSSAKHCAWGSWKSPSNPHLVPTDSKNMVSSFF